MLAARDKLTAVAEYLREATGVFGAGVDESKDALALRTEMVDLLESDDPIDPARVVQLRNAGEDLRRRFAELASRSYRHDHVDAAGDTRKRQLLEGPVAILDALQAVSILAPGPFAQLRSDLVEIRSLFEIDEAGTQELGHPPRAEPTAADRRAVRRRPASRSASGGPTPSSPPGPTRSSTASTRRRWPSRSATSATPPRAGKIETLAKTRTLPDPIDGPFIEALNQVFNRVDIRNVSPKELNDALFPDTSPATGDQLRERLESLLDKLTAGADPERVRFLPKGDDES